MQQVDGATMHYALEARAPFLDSEGSSGNSQLLCLWFSTSRWAPQGSVTADRTGGISDLKWLQSQQTGPYYSRRAVTSQQVERNAQPPA
jgi:hypothetical protein